MSFSDDFFHCCPKNCFQGIQELFLSNRKEWQSVDSIDGKCNIHTLEGYEKLKEASENDFFCRTTYDHKADDFAKSSLFLKHCSMCEWPYNPDHPMIQCDDCKSWVHPPCVEIESVAVVRKMKEDKEHFSCPKCLSKK